MIRLIIFDIGGVIEDFAEEQYIDYICKKLNLDKEEFTDELFRILPSLEEGRITTTDMLRRVALLFDLNYRKLEWVGAMTKLAKINKDVASLVNTLGKSYRVILLTNVSKSRYMENVNIGLFKKVKTARVYASCYLGMSKPGQEIYRYVLKEEGVRPAEAVFIDNMLVNVQGAQKVGIWGIQFISYAKLVKDLKKLGIRW